MLKRDMTLRPLAEAIGIDREDHRAADHSLLRSMPTTPLRCDNASRRLRVSAPRPDAVSSQTRRHGVRQRGPSPATRCPGTSGNVCVPKSGKTIDALVSRRLVPHRKPPRHTGRLIAREPEHRRPSAIGGAIYDSVGLSSTDSLYLVRNYSC